MDADEFLKQVRPAARQSKIAPHLADIRKLRGSGCTLEQVCEFLEKNGVKVSVAGLSAYLRRQDGKQAASSGLHNPQTQKTEAKPASVEVANGDKVSTQEIAGEEDLGGLSEKARRERRATTFIKETPSNTILGKLKKESN